MMEIEVKVEANDVLIENIRKRGKKVGEKLQTDIYFKHPCLDFGETDEALRLRLEEGQVLVTYKGSKVEEESKTREEVEVEVRDGEAMSKIFEKLGFEAMPEVKKEREVFELNDFRFSIDKVEGLGFFVEAETKGGEEAVERIREEMKNLLRELGAKRFERGSYLELLYL